MARTNNAARKRKMTGSEQGDKKRALADEAPPASNKKIKTGDIKVCASCKAQKSRDCFSKNQARKGASGRCRECVQSCQPSKENKPPKKMLTPEEHEALRKHKKEEFEKAKAMKLERKKAKARAAKEKLEREKAKAKAAKEELERFKSLDLDEKVIEFFTKFIALKKDRAYDIDELEGMIEQEPKLLELTCPEEIDGLGKTITEHLCELETAYEREMLFEIVKRGARATDWCYESCNQFESDGGHLDYYVVLMMSGHLPEAFDLDGMVDFESWEFNSTEIMSLLTRNAKPGDRFGCGEITPELCENLKKLPELKAGVTHKKGGPFETFLNEYLEELKQVEDEEENKMKHFKSLCLDDQAVEFFTKFIALKEDEDYMLDEELEEMIRIEPKLLELSCPKEIDEEGLTATEYMCQETWCAGARDMLYDLVKKGAPATDYCYDLCSQICGEGARLMYYLVLMLSGYLPEAFDLDDMVEDYHIGWEDDVTAIISVLTRNAKAGDNFSCGKLTRELCENLKKLPELKAGVTHKKGGPFERIVNKYLEERD